MGSKTRHYDMQEIDDTRNSGKMGDHQQVIEKFLSRGYEILSQEEDEEEGLKHELISRTLITVLKPSSTQLPMIKFEAKEIFGHYNYETQVFEPREHSMFEVKSFKKSSDLKGFNDPWDSFDMG